MAAEAPAEPALTEHLLCQVSAPNQSAAWPDLDGLLLCQSHRVLLSVALETSHPGRARQLAILSAPYRQVATSKSPQPDRVCSAREKMVRNSDSTELDYCLLGLDWVRDGPAPPSPTIGFVLKILWGTKTSLDGDGGFGIHLRSRHYMFKPVSLQSLWTVIQTLHAVTARLRPRREIISVRAQDWVKLYQAEISSPQSCINEWNEMSDILSRRPPSPDRLAVLSSEEADREGLKTLIKSRLRQIMKTVDLDDITSKSIRLSLESALGRQLSEFKSLIDEEILLILGQMDPASRIFDFMYLGSEWNASNLEELNSNGVTHVLNVTREIDNFFPAVFKYLNIREYDVEETDLMQYWDETYRFCADCLALGGRVLIHCKMGISRSASTVCAFAMKHWGWSLEEAVSHTKARRPIVNPNTGFRQQLLCYEGILHASRMRNSFTVSAEPGGAEQKARLDPASVPAPLLRSPSEPSLDRVSASPAPRPASWAPDLAFQLESSPTPHPAPATYHCYSQLSAILTDPRTTPCPAPITSAPPTSPLPRDCMPGCPASSHLSQCTCDLELELAGDASHAL